MAHVRSEPLPLQEIEQIIEYRNSLTLMQESRFFPFLQKFDGFNMVVVLEFARTFKKGRVRAGSLKFKITKDFIAQATGLPLTREH